LIPIVALKIDTPIGSNAIEGMSDVLVMASVRIVVSTLVWTKDIIDTDMMQAKTTTPV
jgi:hypothetical protein